MGRYYAKPAGAEPPISADTGEPCRGPNAPVGDPDVVAWAGIPGSV